MALPSITTSNVGIKSHYALDGKTSITSILVCVKEAILNIEMIHFILMNKDKERCRNVEM